MVNPLQTNLMVMAAIVHVMLHSLLYIHSLSHQALDADRNQRIVKMRSAVQKKEWEPIFFEEINNRAKLAKLGNLRMAALPKDDIELRIWIGFGATVLEGFIIKKRHGQWSAMHLRPIGPNLARSDYQQKLPSPKSGWELFWQHLVEKGVLTLPDSSELKEEVLIPDGQSYVVEVNRGGSYRTYLYSNPHLQKWPEAKAIIDIIQTILDEFGIHRKLLKANS